MRPLAQYTLGVGIFVLMVALVVLWNISVYRECRQDHSISYCVRLVSR